MRFLIISEAEETLATNLYKTSKNSVVRQRCLFIKLTLKRESMCEIARLSNVKWLTVVRFFNAWEAAKTIEEKRATLEIKKGRGAKSKLESVASILPNLVKENSRNLNVILDILAKNNNIKICKLTLQNFLKINRL
jgi:hypothetical protein